MGNYSNVAKLIQLNDSMTVDKTKVKNVDGLIIDGGIGDTPSVKFTDFVQLGYELDIPVIMKYKVIFKDWFGYNLGDLDKGFPQYGDEIQVKKMRGQLFMGKNLDIPRKVQGIMLDFSDNTILDEKGITIIGSDNKPMLIPEGNYANLIKFMMSAVWDQFKKPLYAKFDNSIFDSYKSSPSLMQTLSTLDGMCSFRSANPNVLNSMNIDWDNIPVPSDSYVPQYIADNKNIYFAEYAATAYKLYGITDIRGYLISVPLWAYLKGKNALYNELSFTPKGYTVPSVPVTVPVIPSPVPVTPVIPVPVTDTTIETRISVLENQLKSIQDKLIYHNL